MAQRCEICGRGAQVGHRRSHSNIATKVRRKINLQRRLVAGRRRRICVDCLRLGRVPVVKAPVAHVKTPVRAKA
jgi:large subunit ribosomal protein L28